MKDNLFIRILSAILFVPVYIYVVTKYLCSKLTKPKRPPVILPLQLTSELKTCLIDKKKLDINSSINLKYMQSILDANASKFKH